MFKKSVKSKLKLKLALTGPSGSGKTTAALNIATGLGGKIALADTENESASLYADKFDFDTCSIEAPYTPEKFIEVIKGAEKAGYDTLIIDSATHEWSGVGGCMEIAEQLKPKFGNNLWSAFSVVTPRHRKFVDAILQSKIHVIATFRSKTETAQEKDNNGKTRVVKLGMKSETRDGIEYEFTTVLDLNHDGHIAIASKDRTELFALPQPITIETGEKLKAWLDGGVDLFEIAKKDIQQYTEQSQFGSVYRQFENTDHKDEIIELIKKRKAELGAVN